MGILTQIDTGSQFPRGESPPRHKPLVPPPLKEGPGGRGLHRTHQEAPLTVFVVICEIHLHAADRHPPLKNDSSASRKDTLLHLILSLSQASVPNGYYIRDTSSITRY